MNQNARVLEDLSAVKARMEQMQGKTETVEQELARLRLDNARLREDRAKAGTLTIKVSEKGAVSVMGLQRFPVTLYSQQWERVLAHGPTILAFI